MAEIDARIKRMPEGMVVLTADVHVTLTRWFAFRLWLGTHLLRMAARVMGCAIEVNRG